MLVQQKLGNIKSFEVSNRLVDLLPLFWYETNKRILHKRTVAGTDVTMKFIKQSPEFSQGDILFENSDWLIIIDILPCDTIVIRPNSMLQMASLCYEIGNKHLPLFMEGDEVLVPYEAPLFQWLAASGFAPTKESRKLLSPLKTTTMAHPHASNGTSLFSKILQLTKNATDE